MGVFLRPPNYTQFTSPPRQSTKRVLSTYTLPIHPIYRGWAILTRVLRGNPINAGICANGSSVHNRSPLRPHADRSNALLTSGMTASRRHSFPVSTAASNVLVTQGLREEPSSSISCGSTPSLMHRRRSWYLWFLVSSKASACLTGQKTTQHFSPHMWTSFSCVWCFSFARVS